MILLDALFINNSGGKILLDYLVSKLHQSEKDVFYLLDQRVKGDFDFLPEEKVHYLDNSLIKRHFFYRKNSKKYSSVLCFGNIPPTIRVTSKVYTYFHNSIYFFTSKEFSIKQRLLIHLKSRIIRAFKNNTDLWWVQTEEMSKLFKKKWNFSSENIEVLPFFYSRNNQILINSKKDKNAFLYISDGHPNKMHLQLLDAFKDLHKFHSDTKLYLTISPQYSNLLEKIRILQEDGLGVVNLGWCSRNELDKLYSNSGHFIFPSNQESFGLGLIEAAQYSMKILAPDMPYVHAIIKPSLTFIPQNKTTITEAMITAINRELPEAKLLIKSEIDQILGKLI